MAEKTTEMKSTAHASATVVKEVKDSESRLLRAIRAIRSGAAPFWAVFASGCVGALMFLIILGNGIVHGWFPLPVRDPSTGRVLLEPSAQEGYMVAKTAGSLGLEWVVAILVGVAAFAFALLIICLALEAKQDAMDN